MPEYDEEILAAAEERVGTLLNDKYRLEQVLGVGGMAVVYAATHRNRKRVAIKVLHPEYAVRRDVRQRFVREGYLANSVDHPGVVAVLDDDVDETGAPFLVMELLEGSTVEALYSTTQRPLPVRDALAIGLRVLEVLETAHEKGIVHRDIKPANLFLTSDGRVKILDFGIARLRDMEHAQSATGTGAILGTPAFMAPEQARGAADQVDARTDLWALGASLFTLLSARFVHTGDNVRQIMLRAATEPAPSLAGIAPNVPARVVELIERALRFERDERWQSAKDMRQAMLEVHRELFGAPELGDLVLLSRNQRALGNLPTELSPLARGPRGKALSRAQAARPAAVTTSRPVSTHGKKEHAKRPLWIVLLALASVASLAMFAREALRQDAQPGPSLHATNAKAPPERTEAPSPLPTAVLPKTVDAEPRTSEPNGPVTRPSVPSASPAPPKRPPPSTRKPNAHARKADENPLELDLLQ